MSTYVLMRILESAPSRYDKGLRILTLGRLDEVYDRLASRIEKGQTVLDLGCGTGGLTLRAAARDAHVLGIDVNAEMLEIARQRVQRADLSQSVELREMGVAELGAEETDSYNVVTSGLCFSELTPDELRYTLGELGRVLKPGGTLLVADEVRPEGLGKRLLHRLIRYPLAIIAYLVTQTSTHPVADLPRKLGEAGLVIESARFNRLGTFVELVARNPQE